jgi:hypothetical protein
MQSSDPKLETCTSRIEAGKRNTYWAQLITRLGAGSIVGVYNDEESQSRIHIRLNVRVKKTDPRFIEFMARFKGYMR